VEVLDLPTLRASIPGCEIFLDRRTIVHQGDLTDSGFTSHEVIELHFAERHTLDELEYRFVRPLEQLLTLAVGSRCAALELRVSNEDLSVPWPTNWPLASYAVRRTNSDMVEAGRPVIRERMRFGMNSTGYPPNIDFGSIVQRWYALQERLSSVCDLIFSLRSDTAGYLEQQMFTIASAIEGLHRALNPQLEGKTDEDRARKKQILAVVKRECPEHHQWLASAIQYAHRRSYVFRVRELLRDTSHLMAAIVGDEEAWARQLRDIRDGIGHVLPSQDAKTFHQVVAMICSAQLFAEVVLLRQLGFTDEQCRRSIEHHWERENVRALVKKGFPEWFTASPEERVR
jgi:hypothetical protein